MTYEIDRGRGNRNRVSDRSIIPHKVDLYEVPQLRGKQQRFKKLYIYK